ncbi:hypothetical protein GCM10011344_13540 [Dokdonia pacifica]|uniref:Uncharacterized protein n=1 Tax=Dokdonia pacifica TaxID=1627892 RepID=A0A238W8K9_9FLAO|nr:hypothetical protein [Dokdonia pacifica]GGG14212.1 hypothetical protein GCM10011344_13540 [Dokdonia pacifica]SNR42747.1 hypothetical protein SAMN06265376_101794 [Dokdonia pacifica]
MKYKQHIFLFIAILIATISTGQEKDQGNSIGLLTSQTEFEVGSTVLLQFSSAEAVTPLLYCSNSYGSTVITPVLEETTLNYEIPDFIANKSGLVHWKLIHNNPTSGSFVMSPQQHVATMETYIGPPTIEAGDIDYTMLVVIPTDALDNPMPEGTPVMVHHRFLDTQTEEEIETKKIISYKNISSRRKSGRLFIAAECLETHSTEYTVDVLPAIPTDFTISVDRPHEYADGNQITSFYTSILRDAHANIVSDGTFVTFFIRNKAGNVLKASGTTVQGIATAKMIHPDQEEQWTVQAYVDGMAESNTISIAYQQVVENVEIAFAKANREIQVGPLKSFMNQMIPDGFQVVLEVYKDNVLLETYTKTSRKGYVSFSLEEAIFKNDTYTFTIKTAGLEKNLPNIKLW